MNRIVEFMVLARLAAWNGLDVGVIEDDPSPVFTLVVRFPQGIVFKRIPRNRLEGHWHKIKVEPDELKVSERTMNHRLRQIVSSTISKVINITLE